MDAVEYLKAKSRMTENCTISCQKCLIYAMYSKTTFNMGCNNYMCNHPKAVVAIVEKWAKENPIKTYKSVFFERNPNAPKCHEGYPKIDVGYIFGGSYSITGKFREDWDEEYQDTRP